MNTNKTVRAGLVSARCGRPQGSPLHIIIILAIALWLVGWAVPTNTALALPQDGTVAAGNSTITQPDSNTMNINQSTDKAIINWQGYSIGANEKVQYFQPGSGSISLNRVTGADPSIIYGQLSANGQVWVINPNGLLVGQNAKINVGGFLASTLNINDNDFINGNYNFTGTSTSFSTITNQGNINAADGGYVVFISPTINNSGSITANNGSVNMASGDDVTLTFANNGLINLVINKQTAADALGIDNSGTITADGGQVIISAQTAGDLLKTVINNSGVIQARTIDNKNGVIKLLGGMENNVTNVSGTLDVSAADGAAGLIVVTGDKVLIDDGAYLNASGATGGGEVLVGGSWQGSDPSIQQATGTVVMAGATLDASATGNGNGGTVVVWSDVNNPDSVTRAYGTFLATGGPNGGDGGRIETSGHWLDVEGVRVSTAAPNGKVGEWLIDPSDITITTSGTGSLTSGVFDPSGASGTITPTTILTGLASSNVTIQTTSGSGGNGDITVASSISTTADLGASRTLTLKADRNILFSSSVDIDATTGGNAQALNIVLWADADNNEVGGIRLNDSADIYSNGGNITMGGGTDPASDYAVGASSTTSIGIDLGTGGTHTINAAGGNISFYGKGGTSGGFGRCGGDAYGCNKGIDVANSTLQTSGTGTITLNGVGNAYSADSTQDYNYGVNLHNSTVQTASGAITITGQGGTGTGSNNNHGVFLEDTGSSLLSSSGAISITCIVGVGSSTGIKAGNTSYIGFKAGSGVTSSSSDITLTTDSITLSGDVIQSSGALVIKPYTPSTTIGVGSGSGTLSLPQTYFWNGSSGIIKDGFSSITLGSASQTGDIAVTSFSYSDPLTINAGGSGGDITLTTSIANGTGSRAGSLSLTAGNTISGNASITTNDQSLTINTGSSSGTLSGVLALGSGTLTKEGAGTTVLSGTNTYDGATTISAGTLAITNNAGLGSTTNGTTVASGATLDLQNVTVGAEALTVNGGTIATSTGTSSLSGTVALGADSTVSVAGTQLTLSGIISDGAGTYALTKTGSGTAILSGANTYDGATTISAGTLAISNAAGLGSTTGGTTVTDGASLLISGVSVGNEVVTINGTGVSSAGALQGSGTASLSGTLTANTSATVGGSGSLTLGAISILDGQTLTLGTGASHNLTTGAISGANGGSSSNLTVNTTGSASLGAIGTDIGAVSITAANTTLNTVTANTIAVTDSGASGLTLNGVLTANASNDSSALVLRTSKFTNSYGAGALVASNGTSRWLVYSTNADPFNGSTGDTRNGLVYDFKQYNTSYGGTIQGSGNGLIYSYAPTVSTSLTGSVSKTYDGSTTATLANSNLSGSGAVDSDTLSLTISTNNGTYDNNNIGTNKTVTIANSSLAVSASNGGKTVYGYTFASGNASGAIGIITAATGGTTTTTTTTSTVDYTNVIQEGLGNFGGNEFNKEPAPQETKYEEANVTADSNEFNEESTPQKAKYEAVNSAADSSALTLADYRSTNGGGRHLCLIMKRDGNPAIADEDCK